MQQKRKTNVTGIIVAVAAVVVMVVLMVVWRQYETKHKRELESSLRTTDLSNLEKVIESEPVETESQRIVIPDDPGEILAIAEEAFKDEGYFEPDYLLRGFMVCSLLKKCLNCGGDAVKVEELAKRLKDRSSKTYGAWYIEGDILADLDDSIRKAKQQM